MVQGNASSVKLFKRLVQCSSDSLCLDLFNQVNVGCLNSAQVSVLKYIVKNKEVVKQSTDAEGDVSME